MILRRTLSIAILKSSSLHQLDIDPVLDYVNEQADSSCRGWPLIAVAFLASRSLEGVLPLVVVHHQFQTELRPIS